MARCGVNTHDFPGVTHCRLHGDDKGHVLFAEELANALKNEKIAGLEPLRIVDPEHAEEQLHGY